MDDRINDRTRRSLRFRPIVTGLLAVDKGVLGLVSVDIDTEYQSMIIFNGHRFLVYLR